MMNNDEFDLYNDPAAADPYEGTVADVADFWVEYANTQADRFSVLVVILGLTMGLLLCLLLKRR